MNSLPGNPYAGGAISWASIMDEVAFELRTMNLIALAELQRKPISPDYDMETIYQRLGMDE